MEDLKSENEKLKIELKEKQEAIDILYLEIKRLSEELDLVTKSEKHLEICENALLEKDAEIERLTNQINKVVDSCKNFAPALHQKGAAFCIDMTYEFAQFILTILERNT